MSDIKLFRLSNSGVSELQGRSATVEKSLQAMIERHMEDFLGVRFLASEYPTGKTHGGRIDTLGIDENGCPVIIEYKRLQDENVINQGLFYLDWLLDHKAEFESLVAKQLTEQSNLEVSWSGPRLLCIAGDFTKYDEYAVQQIDRNIELIRYRRYESDLILFELVNATTAQSLPEGTGPYKTVSDYLEQAGSEIKDRFERPKSFLTSLGDDVQVKVLKYYIAFKRIKNFACVEVQPQRGKISVHLKVNPDEVTLEQGFTRDVRHIRAKSGSTRPV